MRKITQSFAECNLSSSGKTPNTKVHNILTKITGSYGSRIKSRFLVKMHIFYLNYIHFDAKIVLDNVLYLARSSVTRSALRYIVHNVLCLVIFLEVRGYVQRERHRHSVTVFLY